MAYEFEEIFMRANALRHVVLLLYKVTKGGTEAIDYASCFIVEIRGIWFLITAGHVVQDMRSLTEDGAVLSGFQLVDSPAGANQPAYPIAMDFDEWFTVDDAAQGIDVAARVINELTVMALRRANVLPVTSSAVCPAEFLDGYQLVLVGAAAERFKAQRSGGQMRMSLIPIVEAPVSDDIPDKGSSILGKIVGDPVEEEFRIQSVKGMSGCPAFLVEVGSTPEGDRKYWAAGIQSTWYPSSRVVRISQLRPLVDALDDHLEQIGVGQPSDP
jgi:hypothetical protein